MPAVKVVLHKSKETKGTWQYKEEDEGRQVRQIYLAKEQVKELGEPESIEVSGARQDIRRLPPRARRHYIRRGLEPFGSVCGVGYRHGSR
jgi:hypothetical protein